SLEGYLKRPDVDVLRLRAAKLLSDIDFRVLRCVEIEVKYDGYIKREELVSDKLKELDTYWIPKDFSYNAVSGLSKEVVEKLKRHMPSTLGQASRISGVTPAAV